MSQQRRPDYLHKATIVIKIQTYRSLYDKNKGTSIDFPDFIKFIRTHRSEADIAFIKDINPSEYQKAKNALPCAALNFVFKGQRTEKNFSGSTGLMYFDIDEPGFNIDKLDKSLIHAYWKSLSGKGYGLVVRTQGSNFTSKEVYKAQVEHIAAKLGILDSYDKNASKRNQGVCIPNDPNAFFNPDSTVFSISNIIYSNSNKRVINKSKYIKKRKNKNNKVLSEVTKKNFLVKPDLSEGKRQIWLDNRHHINLRGKKRLRVYPTQQRLIEVNMGGYQEGNRNQIVSSCLTNAAWLNMGVSVENVAKVIYKMMDNRAADNLPEEEFNYIVQKIKERRDNNTLQPIYSDVKFFMVTAEGESKNAARGETQKEISRGKIRNAIRSAHKQGIKLIQQEIADIAGVTRKTVSKYWSEFKELIKSLKESVADIVEEVKHFFKNPLDRKSQINDSDIEKFGIPDNFM